MERDQEDCPYTVMSVREAGLPWNHDGNDNGNCTQIRITLSEQDANQAEEGKTQEPES